MTTEHDVYEPFREALAQQYSRLNFVDFCKLIGEPPTRDGRDNEYALKKWQAWMDLNRGIGALGTFLPRILNA